MRRTRRYSSLITFAVAATFLAIGTTALAHEIEHDLEQHSEPSCGLHLYVGHAGKPPMAAVNVNVILIPDAFPLPPNVGAPVSIARFAYRGRAPPSLTSTIG